MNFELSAEQEAIRDMVRDFVRRECPPHYVQQLDEAGEFPHDLWNKMGETGILGGVVPEEYGGSGLGLVEECIVIEELARPMFALGTIYQLHGFTGARSIAYFGNEQQKKEFLPRIATGELRFCFGMTEPGGGTDILSSLSTTAVQDGEIYVVNGQKVFTSNANEADYILLIARTSPFETKKALGLSMFIVPTSAPGVEIRKLAKLGGRCLSTCEVFLTDVEVHEDALIGERDMLWYSLLKTLNHERITVAANALGNAQGALDEALSYAKERHAFGRPIGAYQAIQHKLVDSHVEIEMARLLTYKAAMLFESGHLAGKEATAAKMVASEVAFRAASRGMDIWAGWGFVNDAPIQRHFRDSRQLILGPISNEMARNMIAVEMGLPRSY